MRQSIRNSRMEHTKSEQIEDIVNELVARGCALGTARRAAEETVNSLNSTNSSQRARLEMAASRAGYGVFNPLPPRENKLTPVQEQPVVPNMPPLSDDAPAQPDEVKKKKKPKPSPQPQATFDWVDDFFEGEDVVEERPRHIGLMVPKKMSTIAKILVSAGVFGVGAYYVGIKLAAVLTGISYFILTFM